MTEDLLEIPAFLKLSEEQRREARARAEKMPGKVQGFAEDQRWKELEAKRRESIAAAKRENNKKSSLIRANKELAKDAAKMQSRRKDGEQWINGRWQDPTRLSRARYERILSELPTDKHRQIFTEVYADKVIGGAPRAKKRAAEHA